jgi:hypothetical protein
MESGGDSPGPRMGHSMTVKDSVVFLTGGFVYDADTNTWKLTTGATGPQRRDHAAHRRPDRARPAGRALPCGCTWWDVPCRGPATPADVYYLDMRLGLNSPWKRVDGDSSTVLQLQGGPELLDQSMSGMGMYKRRNLVVAPNTQVSWRPLAVPTGHGSMASRCPLTR